MLKSTGIVRKLDELGRVVVPIELRRNLGIGEKDAMEIFVDGESVILRKYAPGCTFDGSLEDLVPYKGKLVSKAAIKEMALLIGL